MILLENPALRETPAEEHPLSWGQRALWMAERLAPGEAPYNLAAAGRVLGEIGAGSLRRAFAILTARHPALRTTFHEIAPGEPVQRVHAAMAPDVAEEDVSRGDLRQRLQEEAWRPFDLETGPPLRVRLFTGMPEGSVLLVAVHHLAADLASLSILGQELGALLRDEAAELRPVPAGPTEWARRQERLADERRGAWWREHLAGELPVLDLPTDRPRPPILTYRGDSRVLRLRPETLDALRAAGRAEGATLWAALLASVGAWLHRITGQEDLLLGSPVSLRGGGPYASAVGYFVELTVLWEDLSGRPSFAELLRRAKREAFSALRHAGYPFALLAERLHTARDPSRHPVVQVLLALQGAGLAAFALAEEGDRTPLGDLELEGVAVPERRLPFDLALLAAESEGGLAISCQYNAALFDGTTVERLLGVLETLLAGMVADPGRPVAELPLLDEAERARILRGWSGAGVEIGGADACLHDLVFAQARRTPEATAVVHGTERATYEELVHRAGELAATLRGMGIGPEARVGVLLERGTEMVVSVLGILAAGGAYVPLDPAHPEERRRMILEDAGISALVTRSGVEARDFGVTSGRPSPGNLAYVLYTSGSTGRPKGVAVEHRSAVARVRWAGEVYPPEELAGVLAATSLGFDLSVFELFVPLSRGGAVILAEDALAFPDLPARGEVTLVNTVPSALAELLRAGSVPASVRVVNLAGEALPAALAEEVHRQLPGARLWNLYGPTEDTTYSTFTEVRPGETPLIGRPLAGTRVYLVDREMQPLPAGIPGELLLGGAGQARGYLGRPDWTAERFVPDPFGLLGGRLYRTGDLVRFRADGALDFLGRIDHQVKVRGFRVELGEIEAALARHPAVEAAAVVLREDRLVAYVAGAATPDDLRSWLRASLPAPMIPSAFVILPRMPLTPTGKVDRRALPTPLEAAPEEAAPATPTEEILSGVVADVLGVSRVGVRESFFDLGGHSLLAARVVSRVREALGVELPLRALFEEPTVAGLARRILDAEAPAAPPLVPRPRPEAVPLSFAQERLWFLWRLTPESPLYNMPAALRLTGPLSVPALAGTFAEIVRRHEALRTRFPVAAGGPVQAIDPPSPVPLLLVDLEDLPEAAREAERLSLAEARRPFDLATGPVLRTTLLRLSPEEHLLLVTMHHAVSDGWSIAVLHRDFVDLYPALAVGGPSPLAPLPVQYADFTLWQRERPLERELAWWRERLADLPPGDLPSDRPRPASASFRGATLRGEIPAGLAGSLRELARRLGVTLFMALHAGFEAVVHRWTGRDDAVTGSPVAGRDRPELDRVVGCFVNTLVLRTDLSGRPGFAGLARRVRETALGAWAHQALPFERLVEELAPERDLAFQPLFQRMFQLLEMPPERIGLGGLAVERTEAEPGAATFDLAVDVVDGPGGLTVQAIGSADLFDPATIERFLGHFERLLAAAAADPERPVTELPVLSEAESRELASWSLGPEIPEGGSLLERFAGHVERTPDRVAVIFEGTELSYRELDRRSSHLARLLSARGVGPERVVGVLLDRSPELIESLLGILKAGGAYLPMDSGTPRERLDYFLENAGASLALTVSDLAGKLSGVETILLDRLPVACDLTLRLPLLKERERKAKQDKPEPLSFRRGAGVRSQADALAYLIYTSGSTGRPKAVGVSYGVLSAHVRAMVRAYGVGPEDRILSFAAPGFDVSVEQTLMALTAGAAVVLRPNELWEPAGLPRRLADLGVTVADLPPAYWNQLAVEIEGQSVPEPRPRLVAAGGDVMQAGPLRRWMRGPWAGVRLFNVYGPTETTITSTAADVTGRGPTLWERVPIGRPLPGRTHYVLDLQGNPVPRGVPGEVCVGGPLLARGYLGRADLTAEKFVPDPWSAEPGGRLYRTGDLARYLPDGELEFAGRTDTQIKIRGFRIEPGEIEAVLASHPAVRQAVAVAREDRPGDRRLAAYVTLDANRLERPKIVPLLRTLCEERLPAWMVPPDIVVLDTLPVTVRGKVDLRALPAPERERSGEAALPRTLEERALASLWSELLGVDRVGVHDNFFALGGHSLLATRVVSRVRQAFAVELPLRHLFEAPTVAGLAARLRAALATAGRLPLPPVEPVPREGDLPLSFGQQRLWFLHRMDPAAPGYLMAGAFRLTGNLSVPVLAAALGEVVRRHEVLRSTYYEGPVQRIHPSKQFFLPVVDLSGFGEVEVRRLAREEAGRPFDLERDLMVRGTLLRLGEREHVALLTLHHIASDGWSVDVLVRELAALYGASPLPELAIQYGDFAVWQRRWLDGPVLEGQLAWWKERLAGAPPVLELPTDRPRPPVRTGRGGRRAFAVPPDLAAALQDLATREGTTLFVLLLAAWQALLGRVTHQEDLVVGTPVAGRRQAETEDLIGFFVNTLVLRADLEDASFRDFLARVHEGALDALAQQDLPFERLVEELRLERSLAYTPIFQVTFALRHASRVPLELPGLTLAQLPFEPDAKFDLELALSETEDGLEGTLDYAADLFDPATAERLAGLYGNLLREIAAAPERRLWDLEILSEAERQQLAEWGDGAALVGEGTVLDLFDAQVERTPDATAVIAGDVSLTYRELAQRSDDVAQRLADRVRPGDVVGLRVERNADLAVGILGIWKAGAVFLPLDPSCPEDRLAFMARDAGSAGILAGLLTQDEVSGPARMPALPAETDLAYLIYTSGTTGTPKAVMVEHGSLVHTLRATAAVFGFEAGERMPSIAPFSFDIFLFELLSPLLSGGTAVILPSADFLLEELSRSTRFHAVPAVLRQVVDRAGRPEKYAGLREIYTGGDAVPADLLKEARKAFPSARLRVLYGPTEGTIVCSFHPVAAEARPLLGRPFPGVSLRLLDRRGNPVPVGVSGEIHVGGPGVARGYLGRPELTAERFVPAPGGARLYRTGDLARFRPDGSLEFLGRADAQVKVRGVRIEPGEVEARLLDHPGVRQAAVVARDEPGGRILAAFYVASGEPVEEDLRPFLARSLPEAMIPSRFIPLDALPLTANAKVDRGALARMELHTPEASATPGTPMEEILAGLFAEVLGMERVGVRDDFFALGGHSLLATRLVSRVREALGVELPLPALFEEPTVAGLARRTGAFSGAVLPPVRPVPRDGDLPLSFSQQRLWFLDQMEPGTPLYNMPALLRLAGPLDVAALETAFGEVVRRHEALRTTFPARRGAPRQEIHPFLSIPLPVVDLSGLPEEARRLGTEETRRPFDLAAGPLLRALLFRVEREEHVLAVTMHHIVSDGWSVGVLVRELAALYGGDPLPPLPVQYADFAMWQREWLAGGILDEQLAWWREQLAGAPLVLELPADRPRPPVRSPRGAEVVFEAPAAGLAALGRKSGATLFMTLLAGFQVLLHRITGQDVFLTGTPVAGRRRPEIEGLIGFFVNTLPLPADLSGRPTVRALLGRVRESALGAWAHQDLPFERLVEELDPVRDPSRTPLVQVLFALQDLPETAGMPGLAIEPLPVPGDTAKMDLTVTLTPRDGTLAGTVEYATDLFDRATVLRLAERFGRLLAGMAEDPGRTIDALPILSEAERRQLLDWGGTPGAAQERTIHELFEEQAERTPDLPAVSWEGGRLTYSELRRRARGLAARLGVLEPEARVAVLSGRSPELVTALLAILYAGGVYVPLDPEYPAERRAFLLRDSGARVLLTGRDLQPDGDELPDVDIAPAPVSPESLAYVIYTSGSTGQPKGVAVPHRAVVRLVLNTDYVRLGPGDRVAQASNAAFDAATFEIWGALLNGAELVGLDREATLSPARLAAALRESRIDSLFLTTALFNRIAAEAPAAFAPVRDLLFGGEAVDPGAVRRVLENGAPRRLLHVYGPTENTTFSTWHPVREVPPGAATVPIGGPIAQTTVHLLDRELRPVPVGSPGEICLGGDSLARGYLGRPDLTAAAFVPDPEGVGQRLYRTGDLARWRPDGAIEFLGRRDGQVKIRGFRIEPGEIEAILATHPAVRQAAVLVREDRPGDRRLVAFVEGAPRDTAGLRAFLKDRLPGFMIPSALVLMDALPLNANGKVDRRALAALPVEPEAREGLAPPRTPVEEGIAAIWSEVLGAGAVSRDDDFFERGGHSLLATQVASRLRESFAVELPLRDLFAFPRLADLAARVEEERRAGAGLTAPPIVPVPRPPEGLPLSFGQEWMWLVDQLDPEAAAYNAPMPVRLSGDLDMAALRAALRETAARHEILRTVFTPGPLQRVREEAEVPFTLADLSALPPDRREAEAVRQAVEEARRPFDLAARPPVRALLLRLSPGDHRLVLDLHHIVTDGWSSGILLREIAASYAGAGLAPLPVQYADFAVWQRSWLSGETLDRLLGHWRERLAGPLPVLELPADRPRTAGAGTLGERLPFALTREDADAFRRLARQRGATLFAALLAGFEALLHRITHQDDLLVGTPVAGRTRRETEDLVGYFVNNLVLRTDLGGDPFFTDLVDRVQETALDAWSHQDLPLLTLVQALHPERARAGAMPLFQAWFQLQNTPLPAIDLPGLALSPWEIETPAATFDVELLTMESEGELRGHLVVNRDLFRRETAERLLGWLLTLLRGAAAAPERRLSELPLLSGEELAQIVTAAGPAASFPDVLPLHRAFEARASEAPDAPAVTFEGETLSYAELDRGANRLAWHLRSLGVGPEVRVGLSFPRSLDLVVAILGILKAGGAYVPLDPDYPRERLDFLAADAGLRVLLTPEDLPETGPETPPGVDVNPDALAYVIYTSGSTGQPKGVMVSHRQAARLFAASASFGFGPGDVWTLFHSYAFDFSVWEIWGALLHGGRLVVVPRWVARSPEAFRDLLAREGVTVLNQTPSAFYQLLQVDEGALRLRWVIFGGEALEPAKLRPWLDRYGDEQPVLVNMFGITETTVHVTLRPLTRADLEAGSVIGRPLPDLSLHLLDRGLQPVPPGVVGEIFVGGAGVARGYHGRPDLTAARFVPDELGGRLYRSGDLAKRRRDGEIEYLGRADQQLKVRGFRIEPGEIESALVRHPAVGEAAVLARRVSAEDVRLVAFLAGRELPPAEELRKLLLETLPEHMVPASFVPLPALPLTPHGKVDRRALAALEEIEAPRAAAEAPANPLEERLAALWAELLEVESVGRDESFFALGGHSLLMTRVATRVREELGVSIPMKSFFDRPTVAGLAEVVEGEMRKASPAQALTPRPPLPPPLSPSLGEGEQEGVAVLPLSRGGWVEWRERGPGGEGPGGGDLRVTTLAFPTANRPDVLARGLASYAATAPHRRFLVLDDSKDPAVRDEYRNRLRDLQGRLGVTVLYAGLEEKRRFAADLAAEAGVDPAVTEAALLDPLRVGLTVGANRNAVLLATVGEGVLSVDDDTLSLVAPSPGSEEGEDLFSGKSPGTAFLSGRDPGEIRSFADRTEALASLDLRPADLAALHEGMLGQPVLVTTNGWAGDCGWHSPSFYMLLEGESLRRLTRTAEGYRTATASKEIVRSVPRTTVGDGDSFMATLFTGLDNRRLLPPFPPVLWGEDLLFGITLQLCFREARVGHLPWVAAHEPVEVRRFWPGEMARSASGVDHSRLVSALLDGFSPDSAEPAEALRRLGRYLLELGEMAPADFDALALRSVRARAEAFAVELEARLAVFDPAEGEGAALWAADVRRYLDVLRKHAEEPDFGVPLDLFYGRDVEEARRLAQRLIANHGLVLLHWPELVEAARRLKEQGRGLAEEARGVSAVSFGQERLWLQDRLSPGSAAYNTANALRLTGRLDVPLLERCFAEIARRHEVLRATFAEQGGVPVQVVHPAAPVELPVADLSALPESARTAELSRLLNEELLLPFDLVRGPLSRVRLVRLAAEEHVLLLTLHHIISDAWSMGVITRELVALHAGSPLPPLRIRYADYARRQREWMAGPELLEQLAWWRERLAGAPEALEIPTDRPRPAVRRFRGGMRTVRLSADLAQAVRALCREREVTLFMALLTAFEILLHARTGEDDLVVGVDVAGRTLPGSEELVGFFVNQLVLRVDLSGDPTVSQALDRVRETAIEAFARQDLPFGRLVEELAPKRSLARNPLFQVMFGLYNVPEAALDLGGITVSSVDIEGGAAVFDLSLYMAEVEDGLLGMLRYDADLFEAATIDRLLEDYETLLRRAVQAPEERVSALLAHLAAERRSRIEAGRESLSKARLKTLKTVRRRPHE